MFFVPTIPPCSDSDFVNSFASMEVEPVLERETAAQFQILLLLSLLLLLSYIYLTMFSSSSSPATNSTSSSNSAVLPPFFLVFSLRGTFCFSPEKETRSMSPVMAITTVERNVESLSDNTQYQKGVKLIVENGVTKIPSKYVLPNSDRPSAGKQSQKIAFDDHIKLPVIDFAELQGANRDQVLRSLANACETYGFFQLVNHEISGDVIRSMMEGSKRFFQLPFEERAKYMTSDMSSPVRYGTSFNQNKDQVFCWRDFLKLTCHPLSESLPYWPSSPTDLRELASTFAEETRGLFLKLVEAIVESLGLNQNDDDILNKIEDGTQLMMVNYYPPCPEPDLTLGMPPHSDYGFLTLLLQDQVEGLQIHFQDKWLTVQPLPNSFVINVGDHLEIFSNGRYKSVLHRVLVNSSEYRMSLASLHSLPIECMVRPFPKLVDEENPRRYMDTDFASFLEYLTSQEAKGKNFLDSRKWP